MHIAIVIDDIVRVSKKVKWPGFQISDLSIIWNSSYMHKAYRESTSKTVTAAFHYLATHDVIGPTLPCCIPCTNKMPIQERTTDLPAISRLKNYSPEDVDLDLFDGYFKSITKVAEGNHAEDDWLGKFSSQSQAMTEIFKESISDVAGCNDDGAGGTRAALYQHFNEVADAVDQVKDPQLNEMFLKKMMEVKNAANALIAAKQRDKEKTSKPPCKKGKMVSINVTKYSGPRRQFNSKNC